MANPPKVDLSDLTAPTPGGAPHVDLSDLGGKPSSKDLALADARKARKGDEVANTVAHGMSLGFSDDLDALGAAAITGGKNLIHDLKGEAKPYGMSEATAASRQADREGRERFAKKMPVTHGALDIGSMLVNPLGDMGAALDAAKVSSPLLRSVLGGAGTGAVAGVGNSGGTPLERFTAAGPGAAFGALTSGALHGLTNPPKAVKGMIGAAGEAINRVKDVMDSEPGRMTPKQHAAGVKAGNRYVQDMVGDDLVRLEKNTAEAKGKPITAAEALGRKGRAQLKFLNRRQGATPDVADPLLAQRSRETASRVLQDIHEVTGIEPGLVRGRMEATADSLRAKAKPLYETWHTHEEVDSPALDAIKKTHSGKRALAEAANIASDEHQDAYKLGLAPEPAEPSVPRNSVVFTYKGARIVAKKGKEAEQVAHQLGRDPAHPDEDGDALWEQYDEDLKEAQSGERPKVITARGWDYMKRGFDKILNEHRDKVTKRLDLSDPGVVQLKNLRKELGDALTDPHTPWGHDAAAAFEAGGDPIRMEEAFDDGKKLISNTVTLDQFKKRLSKISAPDKEALKGGIAAALHDATGQGRLRLKELLTPDAEAKFKMLWGDKKGQELMDRMRIEADMLEHGYKMHSKGGSDTFENIEGGQEQANTLRNAQQSARALRSALKGDPLAAIAHVLSSPFAGAWHAANTPIDEAARNQVGKLLLMKPSELAATLRELGATPEEASQLTQWLEKTGKLGGQAAPRVGGAVGGLVGRGDSEDPDNLDE